MNLHFINAALPLLNKSAFYEIKIKDGKWADFTPQEKRIESQEFASLSGEMEGMAATAYEKWDLKGKILLPGFVDAHMHLDKSFSLAKVPNASGTLIEALRNYAAAYPFFGKEEIKGRILRAALQALSYGTTSIRTHLDFNLKAGADIAFRTVHAALEVKEALRNYIEIQLFPLCLHERLTPKEIEATEEAIKLGVDGIGSIPHLSLTPQEDVDRIFTLAAKYDCPIDFHTDESDDPSDCTISYIADKTIEFAYQGRVAAGHLCSLSAMDAKTAERIMRRMAEANLGVITLPAANMYLQGRQDRGIVRRGITRVRELQEAGVRVAAASDNIHDPFHPFGRGDLIQIGLITGYAAHLGSPSDQMTLLRMITEIPASIIGIENYGLNTGNDADFVILNALQPEEIFTMLPEDRWVYRRGQCMHVARKQSVWMNSALDGIWKEVRQPAV